MYIPIMLPAGRADPLLLHPAALVPYAVELDDRDDELRDEYLTETIAPHVRPVAMPGVIMC